MGETGEADTEKRDYRHRMGIASSVGTYPNPVRSEALWGKGFHFGIVLLEASA
jgi:hypothetical protein